MKTGIHPAYQTITINCACGNSFEAGSTLAENLRVEICSNCHPLYTGKSKLIDTAGRVDKFRTRQIKAEAALAQKAERAAAKSGHSKIEAEPVTEPTPEAQPEPVTEPTPEAQPEPVTEPTEDTPVPTLETA